MRMVTKQWKTGDFTALVNTAIQNTLETTIILKVSSLLTFLKIVRLKQKRPATKPTAPFLSRPKAIAIDELGWKDVVVKARQLGKRQEFAIHLDNLDFQCQLGSAAFGSHLCVLRGSCMGSMWLGKVEGYHKEIKRVMQAIT